MARDANGDFIVVWESLGQHGSANGVFGKRFEVNGAPVGGEFRVNSYTTAGQDVPTLAMDADGDFVVVWSSNGQDGSYFGIFGQRFLGSFFYVLDGFGGVHAGGGAPVLTPATPYFGFDVARDLEMGGTGYYVLDGFGEYIVEVEPRR